MARNKHSEVEQAAKLLGAKGGKVGGRARADSLSDATKSEIARKGGYAKAHRQMPKHKGK